MSIPPFNAHGAVPFIDPGAATANPVTPQRTPYVVSILEFAKRFGGTPERRKILRGLLLLRGDLINNGVTDGYQWINGSFVEDVESIRKSPPNDVDVVTFAAWGDGARQMALVAAIPDLLTHLGSKNTYMVDHYIHPTDQVLSERSAQVVAYWFSMWSNQKTSGRRKGFASVSLNAADDAAALQWIDQEDAKLAAQAPVAPVAPAAPGGNP